MQLFYLVAIALLVLAVVLLAFMWMHLRQRNQSEQALWQQTEQRLQADLIAAKQESQLQLQQLDTTRQRQHQVEKQFEALQAEQRAQDKQIEDLTQRLQTALQELKAERDKAQSLGDQWAQEGKKAESLEAQLNETQKYMAELKLNLNQEKQRHEILQAEYQTLIRTHTQLKTELDERAASHAREVENFAKQKASLSEEFKLLSHEILEAKAKSLQESSQLSLTSVMNPFQQSIESFKKEVQDIHHRETTQQGELRKELESLKELNQKITTEAHELSTALRGQKKLQGNWGELVLENVLDRSGLQLGKDYKREVSITTEEGRQRPDAVVYLPQGKHLIIDAKVSLNAYTRFVNAENEVERLQALKEHVQAVAARIKELADRDYYRLPGLNSPEMVFMFIPIESAFVEALKADETLFQKAIESQVLVATPTTLLTSLNIVRQLWRYEDQNKHTAALASKAEAVFKKLNTFLASFEKIKKGLDGACQAYTTAENQLVSGKGNLVKQVGEFKNLAPAIKAELPEYFVEKAELEIDFIPAPASEHASPNGLHHSTEHNPAESKPN
ncbi:DNA recombination protein RmuC [Nitrincola tapanii]|uniref:DNA recombination protein RmuC n=1 Tax=Nitrincola tapanii TaxID=1708751 RepID=A0A5A9W3U1_9GAMM|nr:DNA recombination protein RmuC [Nitrincola tapanii]KAA0875164.1 DNA recombination protein RmuC [Nitrincola tapanii]